MPLVVLSIAIAVSIGGLSATAESQNNSQDKVVAYLPQNRDYTTPARVSKQPTVFDKRREEAYQRGHAYCVETSNANRALTESQFDAVHKQLTQCLYDFVRKSPSFGSQYDFKGTVITFTPQTQHRIITPPLRRDEYLEYLKGIDEMLRKERTSLQEEYQRLVDQREEKQKELQTLIPQSKAIDESFVAFETFDNDWGWDPNSGWDWGWDNSGQDDIAFSNLSIQPEIEDDLNELGQEIKEIEEKLEVNLKSIQHNVGNYKYALGYGPNVVWKPQQRIAEIVRIPKKIEANIELISDGSVPIGDSDLGKPAINIHIGDDDVKHILRLTYIDRPEDA